MQHTIEATVNQALHTADAEDRCAAADSQFLATFVALSPADKAIRWRGLDAGAKYRLIVRQIEAMQMSWEPSVVAAQIAKYDDRWALGPVDAAVEGALERLALQHSDAARLADGAGDLAHRKHERAAATAFANALIEYRKGVRPDVLPSGAQLLPSRRAGEAAHLITRDGDFVCSCSAGANWHWPLALIIGLEVAHDDMTAWDDGDIEPEDMPTPAQLGQRLCAARARVAA